MQGIIDEFNRFFEGSAEIEIKDESLMITIGTQTMIIQLPSVVGMQAVSKN